MRWKEELAKQVLRNFTLIKMAMHESEGLSVSVCHCANYRRMELITRNAPCVLRILHYAARTREAAAKHRSRPKWPKRMVYFKACKIYIYPMCVYYTIPCFR